MGCGSNKRIQLSIFKIMAALSWAKKDNAMGFEVVTIL